MQRSPTGYLIPLDGFVKCMVIRTVVLVLIMQCNHHKGGPRRNARKVILMIDLVIGYLLEVNTSSICKTFHQQILKEALLKHS